MSATLHKLHERASSARLWSLVNPDRPNREGAHAARGSKAASALLQPIAQPRPHDRASPAMVSWSRLLSWSAILLFSLFSWWVIARAVVALVGLIG